MYIVIDDKFILCIFGFYYFLYCFKVVYLYILNLFLVFKGRNFVLYIFEVFKYVFGLGCSWCLSNGYFIYSVFFCFSFYCI